jgi:hypothetical protein
VLLVLSARSLCGILTQSRRRMHPSQHISIPWPEIYKSGLCSGNAVSVV